MQAAFISALVREEETRVDLPRLHRFKVLLAPSAVSTLSHLFSSDSSTKTIVKIKVDLEVLAQQLRTLKGVWDTLQVQQA